MITISNANPFKIEWTILRGTSAVKEDLSRASLHVWLVSDTDRIPCTSVTYTKGKMMEVQVPMGLAPGNYGIYALWIKNENHVADTRNIEKAEVEPFFAISDVDDEATEHGSNTVLHVQSRVGTYGYDGLDAYEMLVMNKVITCTLSEWLNGTAGTIVSIDADGVATGVDGRQWQLTPYLAGVTKPTITVEDVTSEMYPASTYPLMADSSNQQKKDAVKKITLSCTKAGVTLRYKIYKTGQSAPADWTVYDAPFNVAAEGTWTIVAIASIGTTSSEEKTESLTITPQIFKREYTGISVQAGFSYPQLPNENVSKSPTGVAFAIHGKEYKTDAPDIALTITETTTTPDRPVSYAYRITATILAGSNASVNATTGVFSCNASTSATAQNIATVGVKASVTINGTTFISEEKTCTLNQDAATLSLSGDASKSATGGTIVLTINKSAGVTIQQSNISVAGSAISNAVLSEDGKTITLTIPAYTNWKDNRSSDVTVTSNVNTLTTKKTITQIKADIPQYYYGVADRDTLLSKDASGVKVLGTGTITNVSGGSLESTGDDDAVFLLIPTGTSVNIVLKQNNIPVTLDFETKSLTGYTLKYADLNNGAFGTTITYSESTQS